MKFQMETRQNIRDFDQTLEIKIRSINPEFEPGIELDEVIENLKLFIEYSQKVI